jgi:hypothetical protein
MDARRLCPKSAPSTTMSRRHMLRHVLLLAVLAVWCLFCAAVLFHALLVAKWLSYGHRGQLPTGHWLFHIAFILCVVTGVTLLLCLLLQTPSVSGFNIGSLRATTRLIALLPLPACAIILVRAYSPDPSYLPRRVSIIDGGTVQASHLWLVTALAVTVATWATIRPRLGLWLVPLSLGATAFMMTSEGFGH